MEWHHLQSPRKKKYKKSLSSGKVMITVFWDCGVILVDAMVRGETINSEVYIRTLTEHMKCFKRVQPPKKPTEILLQHDNARWYTRLKTLEAIIKFGWTVNPSTVQPRPSTLRFPPIWSPEGCSPWYKI
ncbi:hypothetical protein Cfor_10359 [Coptotermes formosanus]|jgi:hypothetical protein|uniref:Tc1-like transposase DDE domain-containing protein n=1 Tax=Coptotermes formosanus TaxID=36987 RepID=A0A6L2Q301_COPFO|nr:hypothetical protein Cfor_10359 [Coptotermes formosanus]